MRLHRLEAVAFGPFADRVEVDFDALSDAGLFLLTGATGAGKTSVLDAVCFALYGAVPGDRQVAKRLRSDHAAAGVAPAVALEFSVGGRRFRIDRSPAWERPRKRGTGTTREQAACRLVERVSGEWVPRASRLDEAGHLVSELLGLTLGQFCQVQLLPQGRFQAFLRADTDERHRLLQRLFRTARFEDVEQWLREQRRDRRREADRRHDAVAALVGRVSEASGRDLPAGWDPHDLRPAADLVAGWLAEVGDAAAAAREEAEAGLPRLAAAEQAAREALDHARSVRERRDRWERARAREAALRAGQAAHQARVDAVAGGRSAGSVLPHWQQAERAAHDAALAEAEAAHALQAARDALARPGCEVADLAPAADEAVAAAGRARAQVPHVAEVASLETALAETAALRADVADRAARHDARAAELPGELARARAAELTATGARDRVAGALQAVELEERSLEAARSVVRLAAQLAEAETLHRASVDAAQELRETWLHVQQQRLEGMAAEIAGALAVGACCPVCGSADHPHLARAGADAPDLAAERAARRAVDDAETERHARSLAVHDLRTRLGVARERCGDRVVADVEQTRAAASAALAEVRAEAATLPIATRDRELLEVESEGLAGQAASLAAEGATLAARDEELGRRHERLRSGLEGLLAGTGHDDPGALADHLDGVARVCRAATDADHERRRTHRAAQTARARAEEAGTRHGFPDEVAVRAAALPSLLLERLEVEVGHHEAARATVAEVLADPDLLAASRVEAPDLDGLQRSHASTHDAHARALAVVAQATERVDRLSRLTADLHGCLATWGPARAELAVAEQMASLADGTSPDNRLRMRLSAYVLAARLGQVVDAANERLARMFDHRYALEHTGDRGVGQSRGGLGLRVRDDWTGEARDPATLSGGETFVVSLALALGLADVISHEAGGAGLDTLFVDEGFGSLDAETLDQVLDTLDSLRDGGRVVGVVSHVAEMQMRIPTQLHVRKQRVGSTLAQAH